MSDYTISDVADMIAFNDRLPEPVRDTEPLMEVGSNYPENQIVIEPSILTANTFYWTPSRCASSRRSAENRRQGEAESYFLALGMERGANGWFSTPDGLVRARFSYSESCKNVYKNLEVTVAGDKSNILSLRKLADPAKREAFLKSARRKADKKQIDGCVKCLTQ